MAVKRGAKYAALKKEPTVVIKAKGFPGDIPPDMEAQCAEATKRIEAAMDAMTAEHGEKFTDAVKTVMTIRQMHMALMLSGAPPEMLSLHIQMSASIIDLVLKALGEKERLQLIEHKAQHIIDTLGIVVGERVPGLRPSAKEMH